MVYHCRPTAITAVRSSSKRHHPCIHPRATNQFLNRSCASSISIIPCPHRCPLRFQCISASITVSKSPKRVLIQTYSVVSLPPFSATSGRLLSALFYHSFHPIVHASTSICLLPPELFPLLSPVFTPLPLHPPFHPACPTPSYLSHPIISASFCFPLLF